MVTPTGGRRNVWNTDWFQRSLSRNTIFPPKQIPQSEISGKKSSFENGFTLKSIRWILEPSKIGAGLPDGLVSNTKNPNLVKFGRVL
jgi:hypothetical protein